MCGAVVRAGHFVIGVLCDVLGVLVVAPHYGIATPSLYGRAVECSAIGMTLREVHVFLA